MSKQFDHVLIAVDDLDAAAARLLDLHGLASVAGGRHAGHGTANRIVPLGDAYLELVAVVDPDTAATSDFAAWVRGRASADGRLLGWCLRSDDVSADAERLGLATQDLERPDADGNSLAWVLTGLEAAVVRPSLPFFAEFLRPFELHPARAAAGHRNSPHDITWIEVAGDADEIGRWVDDDWLDVRVVVGDPGPVRLSVATAAGEVLLT